MLTRSNSTFVTFNHPFELKGVDRILPPGLYRVVTDEELIQELSFPAYRRVSTTIYLSGQFHHAAIEMAEIDPQDLQGAQDRDKAAHQG